MKRIACPLIIATCAILRPVALAAQGNGEAPSPPRQRFTVDVKRDIVYSKPDADTELKLDAYIPKGAGPFPAVLVVHGGAWMSGNKQQLMLHASRFAEEGMAAFAINYRLAPKYKFPAQIHDCKAAVRWVRGHATDYSADPSRIGVYGYSAGGHLAALLGVTDSSAELEGDTNGEKTESCVQCVCAGGAPCDFQQIPGDVPLLSFWLGGTRNELPDIYRKASPMAYVASKNPPMFFFHGSKDELVNIKDVERMVQSLKGEEVETELLVLDGANHIGAIIDPKSVERSAEFFAKHLKSAGKSK